VDDRQAGVLRKPGVDIGLETPHELAAPVIDDGMAMPAVMAEPGWGWQLAICGSIVHHGGMFTSEAVTRDIRVSVVSEYAPGRSSPQDRLWFFLYTISISNESAATVQLLSRHWIITNGSGEVEEVKGPGVVGEQPVLAPHETFTYTSGCPLTTPFGMMEGTYDMVSASGEHFLVRIAPFTLSEPYTVH